MSEQEAQGLWDSTEPYAKKVKFEVDKPVLITFPNNFTRPKEMPATNSNDKPFLIFDVLAYENQESAVIMTSSITMIRNLKSHEPLSGKSLMITKKNIQGKNMFYVENAEQFKARNVEPAEVDTDEAGINDDGSI